MIGIGFFKIAILFSQMTNGRRQLLGALALLAASVAAKKITFDDADQDQVSTVPLPLPPVPPSYQFPSSPAVAYDFPSRMGHVRCPIPVE